MLNSRSSVYVLNSHRNLLLLSTTISAVLALRQQCHPPPSQAPGTFLVRRGTSSGPLPCLVNPPKAEAGGPTFPVAAAATPRYGDLEANYTGSYCCQDGTYHDHRATWMSRCPQVCRWHVLTPVCIACRPRDGRGAAGQGGAAGCETGMGGQRRRNEVSPHCFETLEEKRRELVTERDQNSRRNVV